MYRYSPGSRKVTVVVTVVPAGIETSVGRAPWMRLGPGAMALVERLVADEPLVVDRVGVASSIVIGTPGRGRPPRPALNCEKWILISAASPARRRPGA